MADTMHPIAAAEHAIATRLHSREATQLEHRGALALEVIADEMTRLRAEVSTLRDLFATYVGRPR